MRDDEIPLAFLDSGAPASGTRGLGTDAIGSRIGAYQITALIGAGGMGEVYRAHDSRLKREVAIKVLPHAYATDPERLARFQREAELLASVNHPNIAAVFGLEQTDDAAKALVMELVEGDTLADRLAPGPLPASEALGLARQIAEALEAAHERGIIHRDLKPANIKVTPDGKVKVLDFGLAKIVESSTSGTSTGTLANSPTIASSPMVTRTSIVLGTAAYMSPEQARGQAVDKRSDIWAFGCVMFEMLTGVAPFAGSTTSETIGRIFTDDPDWDALPVGLSPTVTAYLRRCLQKNPRDRVHDAGDLRLALDGVLDPAIPTPRNAYWLTRLLTLSATVLAVTTIAAVWLRRPGELPHSTTMRRFAVTLAPASLDISHAGPDLAMTPDGSSLVYFARRGTGRQLYLRRLDALDGTPLLDAEQYGAPFVSPDGAWIGVIDMFTAEILKIPTTGGPPVSIVSRASNHLAYAGATWGIDDMIVFARGTQGLWRVPAAGGTPAQLIAPDISRGEFSYAWPELLPGGKAVLFTCATRDGLQVHSLNLDTLEQQVLIRGASGAKYSSTGHVLYGVTDGTGLHAVPFDPVRLKILGTPTTTLPDVMGKLGGVVNFSVAADGTLAYIPGKRLLTMGFGHVDPIRSGNTGDLDAALMWFDRVGNPGAKLNLTEHCRNPTLSPDERRVAVECYDAARKRDVWNVDLERGTSERMTFEPTGEADPVWSPDGGHLLFSSVTDGPKARTSVLRKAISSGVVGYETIYEAEGVLFTQDISADGDTLLLVESPSMDIVMLPVQSRGPLKPVVKTPFAEIEPQFSPNGKYVSYASNESGRFEVYIQPWPATGQKWKVSVDGGTDATWRRDGRELFYIRPDKTLMAVSVDLSTTLRLGTPTALFRAPIAGPLGGGQRFPYAATRDGQRFLIYTETSAAAPQSINVVVNWSSNLHK